MSRMKWTFLMGSILSLVLSACGSPAATSVPATTAPQQTEIPTNTQAPSQALTGDVALKVTGAVAKETAWTEAEVEAMKTLDVQSTNNKGEASTYTGVLITDLLAEAQPNADATTVVFVARDGSTAEVSLQELNPCTDCILSFRNRGGFSLVLPGKAANLQVKDVVEIQVK